MAASKNILDIFSKEDAAQGVVAQNNRRRYFGTLPMHHPRRSILWLIAGISGVSALAWFANTYTPDSWQMIVIFFTLITVITGSLLLYFLNNVLHVLLITGGLLILLILRLLGLREIIYPLLLIASLLSIELMLRKR